MMKRSLVVEWMKLRNSKWGLILSILPIISLLIGCANYYLNQDVLTNGWYSLWGQVSLFYGQFFLPILIAICCAYICRIEHLNQNWHLTMSSPVSVACVYFAKWIVVGLSILFAQLLFLGLYWIAGILLKLSAPFPVEAIGWIFSGWYALLSISALQLGLSMRIRSFAVPIGIRLCGVIVGLALYINQLGTFFPFSLLTIGMSIMSRDPLTFTQNLQFWGVNLMFVLIFSIQSIWYLKNKEIVSS